MSTPESIKSFLSDRFGMFIHWGLYAIPARGEWVRHHERISNEDYRKYFDAFNPTDYDPKKWARLAKQAGMKYAVMTAKHHDGFCLFDTKLTDYKSTNTKGGRDLIREYVDAFRAEGIKIGFYYSLLDWHHDDYPRINDAFHPQRGKRELDDSGRNFDNYVKYLHGQVRELLTNYGKIDVMWFDFSYDNGPDNCMSGDKWRAAELMDTVHTLMPEIVVDNRLYAGHEGGNNLKYGDFLSPEQYLPKEGLTNSDGVSVPWEACITLNNNWGYHAGDHDYKSAKDVIRLLVECVSKNGNLLLNVGPDARGNIPEKSVKILTEVGEWMAKNSESIHNCGYAGLDKPEWGRFTKGADGTLYAHIYDRGVGPIRLPDLAGKVKSAALLADKSEVGVGRPWDGTAERDLYLHLRGFRLPDEIDTVVGIKE